MIATILPGSTNFHAVGYNERKIAKGTARLLEMKNFGAFGTFGKPTPDELVSYLMEYTSRNDRIQKAQFHVSFSCKGHEMSEAEVLEFAHRYLKEMGYMEEGQPLLAYSHYDTDNTHVHIVTSRIAPDGRKIEHDNERRRSQEVIDRILGNDRKQKTKESVDATKEYTFSSFAQFKSVMLSMGYETYQKDDTVFIKHGGKVQQKIPFAEIAALYKPGNWDRNRCRQLRSILKKYRDVSANKEELKKELASMPKGLLHLEAGIQSLHEEVLTVSRRAGKLADALEGLRYLCALDNMETHADLIAGLPLYHLSQIFDDVRTLAEYRAGEIQLESLKLLPGTEMRRRAEELGICYSPLPPYEVLQTREITPDELQTARQLSRLLDGFYNAPAWQEITRRLIVEEPGFLTRFLDHLIQIGVIDQPMGLERRGILLYHFCKEHYPHFLTAMSRAWIEAGMSLKKEPAERVRTKHVTPPEAWTVCTGTYRDNLRLCKLPASEEGRCYWYGFETESQQLRPVFAAVSQE